jgi:tRNA A-37 threonylcarbamoyl transferase component Bud32
MPAPTAIGRYEVIRELGRGAMGTVFLARDTALGRFVALKTFRSPHQNPADPEDSGALRRRTLREAQRAGTLSHPNVITIFDVVELPGDEGFYIVMEYVEGRGLDARMREGPMTLLEAAPLVSQIASALDHLHTRGIVHRDVKPGNVLVTDDGRLKITDFGIARSEDPASTNETDVYGTPYYMAPEQIQGLPVDGRTDVFALGVVLYEMLTGSRPFPGATVAEVAHRIVYGALAEPEVEGRSVSPALRELLYQALAKDPADRFPTAGTLAEAVQDLAESTTELDLDATKAFPRARNRWLAGAPPPAAQPLPRAPSVIAAVMAAVLLLLGAGFLYVRAQRGAAEDPAGNELQARLIGYVKLVTEGKRLLGEGDPQGAALLFQAAEGLAVDPAGAQRLREEAQRMAEDQGAHLQLLDARQDLASGHYDQVVATARQMLATRAGREKAAGVLAEVQEALARGERESSRPQRAPARPPTNEQLTVAQPTPEPPSGPGVDFGVLHVELRTDSPEGILTLWVDEREVARHAFEFYERTGFFRKRPVPGAWATDLMLAPGSHPVRLLIARPGEAGQVATLEAPVEAGILRTLAISLPSAGAPLVELR